MGTSCKLIVTLLAALPLATAAQTIIGMTIEPPQATDGAPVKITVQAELKGEIVNCGLRLHFGDGQTQDFKIVNAAMLPLRVEHIYAKAGSYQVMAEPKRVTSHLKCVGENQRGTVAVAAASVMAVAAPTTAPATASACPEGWKLDPKSVQRKSGAFMCSARAGTAAPANRLDCPGDLGYFENVKKGQLGCRA